MLFLFCSLFCISLYTLRATFSFLHRYRYGALVLSVVRQNPEKDTGSCVLIAINDKNYVKQNVFRRLKDIEAQGHLMKQILRVIVHKGSVFSGNGITCYIIRSMLHLKMCSWLGVCTPLLQSWSNSSWPL